MDPLSVQDLAQACRIFMELAYADAWDKIPPDRRPYCDIPSDALLADYLPPGPIAHTVCKDLTHKGGGGYEFRLGSAEHQHLKLRIQPMEFHDRAVWVFSVDTHDRFLQAAQHLQPEEAKKWRDLVEQNRNLKRQIEDALSLAGFLTPKGLLQIDLTPASPS